MRGKSFHWILFHDSIFYGRFLITVTLMCCNITAFLTLWYQFWFCFWAVQFLLFVYHIPFCEVPQGRHQIAKYIVTVCNFVLSHDDTKSRDNSVKDLKQGMSWVISKQVDKRYLKSIRGDVNKRRKKFRWKTWKKAFVQLWTESS